jgi:hypothetical protein
MEQLCRCTFKCWKNGKLKTLRTTHADLFYDSERNWVIACVGKRVRSSYRLSCVTDVQLTQWGAWIHHAGVTVWVTDDDGDKFRFYYESNDAPGLFAEISKWAESSSPYLKARRRILELFRNNDKVYLGEVVSRLAERAKKGGFEAAREEVEHLVEVQQIRGHLDGDFFVCEGMSGEVNDALPPGTE